MNNLDLDIQITEKQEQFTNADADEVLFGGAAGGGKSYGQLVDALLYALIYSKSKQIIFRRTYPELEKSLIRVHLEFYPRPPLYKYNRSKRSGIFVNGSIIDFAYCDNENDVYKYQSAEYDVIRFDELTHFTEAMYIYLLSRLRGTKPYPRQMKSTTNPGGLGHAWVKKRFIDVGEWNKKHYTENGTRLFIPSKLQDNKFLMGSDPGYVKRLDNLTEKEKRALKYGEWDIFEGQFFDEFDRGVHVVSPFVIPKEWKKYITRDYGLDMTAVLWIAVDYNNNAYVYKELYKPNLIISEASKNIKEMTTEDEDIYANLGPPDLWNRRQETGKSAADIFAENDDIIEQTNNNRINGWLAVKEWLKVFEDEQGIKTSKLKIFSNCTNLIRTLPALRHDDKNPNDVANEPHELTHLPDALRGFCIYWITGSEKKKKVKKVKLHESVYEDYKNANEDIKKMMLEQYGNIF